MNNDLDRLGEAVGGVYQETHNELEEYTNNLIPGGQKVQGGRAAGRTVNVGGDDINRILGSEAAGEDFYEAVPTRTRRTGGLQDDDSGGGLSGGDVADEEVPDYREDNMEPMYEENNGAPNVDINIDNPTTTKGKIISLVYLGIMFMVLLFGLNVMITMFKSKENPEDTFDLNTATNQLRGTDTSSRDVTTQVMDDMLAPKNDNQGKSYDGDVEEPDTGLEAKTELGTGAPVSNQGGGQVPTIDTNQQLGNLAASNINDYYTTHAELEALTVQDLIMYSYGAISYRNYEKGQATYTVGSKMEHIEAQVFNGVAYIQISDDGIVFKSPVSKKYLYFVVSKEMQPLLHTQGVATVRSYVATGAGEVYADVYSVESVNDRSSSGTQEVPPVEQEKTSRARRESVSDVPTNETRSLFDE